MKTIVDRIGKPALLEQTAEECAELAHACLKEARRLRGENPTPKSTPECWLAISEELTDLLEATDDILVRAGVLADDCAAVVAGHDGSRVLLDRKRPRVEITITEMEEVDHDEK